MKKYPKAWIDAVRKPDNERDDMSESFANNVLDTLQIVGALKDVPKPREFYVCTAHHAIEAELPDTSWMTAPQKSPNGRLCFGLGQHEWIKVREVSDE